MRYVVLSLFVLFAFLGACCPILTQQPLEEEPVVSTVQVVPYALVKKQEECEARGEGAHYESRFRRCVLPDCGDDMYWKEGTGCAPKCRADRGLAWDPYKGEKGGCVCITRGFEYSPHLKKCASHAEGEEALQDALDNPPRCPEVSQRRNELGKCVEVCTGGFWREVEDECVCPKGMTYVLEVRRCVRSECSKGYEFRGKQGCVPICDPMKGAAFKDGICVCGPGTAFDIWDSQCLTHEEHRKNLFRSRDYLTYEELVQQNNPCTAEEHWIPLQTQECHMICRGGNWDQVELKCECPPRTVYDGVEACVDKCEPGMFGCP